MDYIFENNREWVAGTISEDPDTFKRLATSQQPKYLYIGCSDSRVPAQNMMVRGYFAPPKIVRTGFYAIDLRRSWVGVRAPTAPWLHSCHWTGVNNTRHIQHIRRCFLRKRCCYGENAAVSERTFCWCFDSCPSINAKKHFRTLNSSIYCGLFPEARFIFIGIKQGRLESSGASDEVRSQEKRGSARRALIVR